MVKCMTEGSLMYPALNGLLLNNHDFWNGIKADYL